MNSDYKKSLQDIATSVKILSMDAVQKANSGHPGLPMGCAEFGALMYAHVLHHNPKNPKWLNRDRFVLSAGHGSMFLYSLLHLSGFNLPMSEIQNFRQLHSKTPGHPEYHMTPGVEATTGPLGQGVGNAIGQALGIKMLASQFNKDGFELFNAKVFFACSCYPSNFSYFLFPCKKSKRIIQHESSLFYVFMSNTICQRFLYVFFDSGITCPHNRRHPYPTINFHRYLPRRT